MAMLSCLCLLRRKAAGTTGEYLPLVTKSLLLLARASFGLYMELFI